MALTFASNDVISGGNSPADPVEELAVVDPPWEPVLPPLVDPVEVVPELLIELELLDPVVPLDDPTVVVEAEEPVVPLPLLDPTPELAVSEDDELDAETELGDDDTAPDPFDATVP